MNKSVISFAKIAGFATIFILIITLIGRGLLFLDINTGRINLPSLFINIPWILSYLVWMIFFILLLNSDTKKVLNVSGSALGIGYNIISIVVTALYAVGNLNICYFEGDMYKVLHILSLYYVPVLTFITCLLLGIYFRRAPIAMMAWIFVGFITIISLIIDVIFSYYSLDIFEYFAGYHPFERTWNEDYDYCGYDEAKIQAYNFFTNVVYAIIVVIKRLTDTILLLLLGFMGNKFNKQISSANNKNSELS